MVNVGWLTAWEGIYFYIVIILFIITGIGLRRKSRPKARG
jgi:hypothetical protein